MRHYGRQKVGWLWLVDPVMRTVEVLRLQGEDWLLAGTFGGEEKARVPPFDAVELELGVLWEPPAPPPPQAQEPGPAAASAPER